MAETKSMVWHGKKYRRIGKKVKVCKGDIFVDSEGTIYESGNWDTPEKKQEFDYDYYRPVKGKA